ncbi:phage tail tape measure protein [Sodaliphilus pleomorphus]|uniref:Phage tail tape measure protein domain-containing protein n=1 Tax=Sodaliphilus pleomorphus TaxID=2606626 RepID=A0A6L5XCJ8_9BACT|nr:phage tail tape measure protein [Sodaliphilus pleomorphus]MSS16192.1 hypothetical protein [Sodaliphilus pleomorphus]
MAKETLITDLVAQDALDQLDKLDTAIEGTLGKFQDCARELARGLKVNVEVNGDLDRLKDLSNTQMQQAAQATQQLTSQLQQQQQVVSRTTAAIAEQLQKQAQANEATRQSVSVNREAMAITDKVLGSLQENIHLQAQYKVQISQVNKEMSDLKKQFDNGGLTQQQYANKLAQVTARKTELTVASQKLQSIINADQKIMMSAEGSYDNMSQSLVRLKQAMRSDDATSLSAEQMQLLIQSEQQLSNELKHQDELMGEHQRNVGDYSIALQNGVASTDDLNRVLGVNAATIEGCIEQNKALEEAKTKLDTQDSNYTQTLERINEKIAENKQRISDVSDILGVQAHSVEEAEQQNRRLAEALKLIDDRSAGASEKIRAYNAQIQANKNYIQQNASSLRDNTKESNALFQQIAGLIGINTNFGASLRGLSANAAKGGSLLTGMGNSLKAFGSTLLGLLKNPYVLAVAGVGMGFKWFYDYNKGLLEATRLTKYFSGLTGDAMKSVRDNVQAVSDTFGQDFTSTLKAANAISQNMGVSINDAVDLISKGFAAGGVNSQQFLSNLERFAPTFDKMGMSAEEMVAVLSQLDKAGVNSQRALMAMNKASLQLRTMSKGTSEALKGIGIDASEMSRQIQNGEKSVREAMSEIAEKLKGMGANSKEAAAVMKELFGARGESAIGEGFLTFLANGNKGLEELLGKQDSLQHLKIKEVEVNKQLNDVLASMFDMTGGGFESITAKTKIWIKEGLIAAIKWVVDLINYFIEWYNESMLVRAGIQYIYTAIRTTYALQKVVFNVVIDAIKAVGRGLHALGDIYEGVFSGNFDKAGRGFRQLMGNFKVTWTEVASDAKAFGKEIGNNLVSSINAVVRPKKVALINYNAVGSSDVGDGGSGRSIGGGNGDGGSSSSSSSKSGKSSSKSKTEASKEAQEELKIIEQLEELKVNAMQDGIAKTLALIRLEYKKKLDAIKGHSAKEEQLRVALAKECSVKVAQAQAAYDANRAEIDLKNRLAAVEEGSEEEYHLKMVELDRQYALEVKEAEKTGADVQIIFDKYNKQILQLNQDYAKKKMDKIAGASALEQAQQDAALQNRLAALKGQEAKELKAVGNNEAAIQAVKDKYANLAAEEQEKYAIETAKRQMDAYKKQIDSFRGEGSFDLFFADDLGDVEGNADLLEKMGMEHDQAVQLAQDMAKKQAEIANAVEDAEIAAIDRVNEKDKKAREARVKNAEDWLQKTGEAIEKIGGLVSSIYDSQISKIEELLDAEQDQYDKEVEHIEYLADRGAITTEEAEIRKRDAAAATAAKQEQLEKRKAQIEYKKALMEKANNIAQIGIATALGIMQALAMTPPNIPLSIFIGAMGAIQTAAALAQPIKAYKEGTKKPHPGGLALVGDGDKAEVVLYNGKAWVTPDSPTLVDLPKGAEVYPDADKVQFMGAVGDIPRDRVTGQPIIINDYSALESRVATNTKALSRELRQFSDRMAREMKRMKFNAYLAQRI